MRSDSLSGLESSNVENGELKRAAARRVCCVAELHVNRAVGVIGDCLKDIVSVEKESLVAKTFSSQLVRANVSHILEFDPWGRDDVSVDE